MRKWQLQNKIENLEFDLNLLKAQVDTLKSRTGVVGPATAREISIDHDEAEQGLLTLSLLERIRKLESAHVWKRSPRVKTPKDQWTHG